MIKKASNEGKIKVVVPNETFKPDKAHHFRSFVQYIRIYIFSKQFMTLIKHVNKLMKLTPPEILQKIV